MRIELRCAPDCPNVAATRRLLQACLVEAGLTAMVREREGAWPSPTLLVDGRDVMGAPPTRKASCRLDVPTRERILAALQGFAG